MHKFICGPKRHEFLTEMNAHVWVEMSPGGVRMESQAVRVYSPQPVGPVRHCGLSHFRCIGPLKTGGSAGVV